MRFHFCFCFFSDYCYRNYEFCNRIKNLCSHCSNYKLCKSIIKKKKKRHDKILSIAKSKLNTVEILISKALIYSNVSHAEFVLINNVLKEFDNMKEEIENSNDKEMFKYI